MRLESNPRFRPITYNDGYLPLEDHGLIGDGRTAALIGRDGVLSWLCLPRFDSPPIFCRLLDHARGGAFIVAPEDLVESRQFYEEDSAVLVTEMRSQTGLVRLTDALTLRREADLSENVAASRDELIRHIEVLEGQVKLRVEIEPRGGFDAEARGGGLALRGGALPEIKLHLTASRELTSSRNEFTLKQGETLTLALRWGASTRRHQPFTPEEMLHNTRDVWQRWTKRISYDGPQAPLVHRSAITLKLLDYFENGAVIASPTSSLPELIGGERNWDYRYTWIRDASFSAYGLHRIGCYEVSAGFLGWVLDVIERDGYPRVLYDIDGKLPPPERIDSALEGYRRSRPVRWGNAAADQVQHDVYGEILDCAWQWAKHYGKVDAALWSKLEMLIEAARREWRSLDQSIWEVRTPGRPFTYSAALCQVALDRGARLAERFNLAGDTAAWHASKEEIRRAILEESWDEKMQSLTEHLGGGGLDASLLSLPLRRVIPADHPRMIATTKAIADRLSAGNGLLYRYLLEDSPDGLRGHDGAFLLCSFWLVDNLAYQGQLDQAMELYDSLCARANPLGLLPEQIDPSSGTFLGNFPQAFSHVGLISSGVNLHQLINHPT